MTISIISRHSLTTAARGIGALAATGATAWSGFCCRYVPTVTAMAVGVFAPDAFAAGGDPITTAVNNAGNIGVSVSTASAVCAGVGAGLGIAFGGGGMLQRAGVGVVGSAVAAGSPTLVTTIIGTGAGAGLLMLVS